jgi:hypothetical protein
MGKKERAARMRGLKRYARHAIFADLLFRIVAQSKIATQFGAAEGEKSQLSIFILAIALDPI